MGTVSTRGEHTNWAKEVMPVKKLTAFVLALVCILIFGGCNPQNPEIGTTQNIYTLPASLLTCCTAEHPDYQKPDLEISQEQAEFMLTVWNESSWVDGTKEAAYVYVFRGENVEIQYCYEEGIFNDTINSRHIVLSSSLRKQVNNTIDKFIVLPYVD